VPVSVELRVSDIVVFFYQIKSLCVVHYTQFLQNFYEFWMIKFQYNLDIFSLEENVVISGKKDILIDALLLENTRQKPAGSHIILLFYKGRS